MTQLIQQIKKYKLYGIFHESAAEDLLYVGRTGLTLEDRLSRHISKARTCLNEMKIDIDHCRTYSEMAMHIIEHEFTGFSIQLIKYFEDGTTMDEMIRAENETIIDLKPLLNIVNVRGLSARTVCPCGGIVIKRSNGHYLTAQHQAYLYFLEHGVKPAKKADIPNRYNCPTCNCSVALAGKRDHEKTKKHIKNINIK